MAGKVDMPNSVTFLNWTPLFEGHVCDNEWGERP